MLLVEKGPFRPPTLRPPVFVLFYFSSAIGCLWFCSYDIINLCCISLKGWKWAFTPTSNYKNKHSGGGIFCWFFLCDFCITLWAGVTCTLCLGPVGSAVILYCLLLCTDIKVAPWQVLFLALISYVCCILWRLSAHTCSLEAMLGQECRCLVQLDW